MAGAGTAARITGELGQLSESLDLLFALDPYRVAFWQPFDHLGNPVSDLEREVRGRWAGEGTDVLDRDRSFAGKPVCALEFAHGFIFASPLTEKPPPVGVLVQGDLEKY